MKNKEINISRSTLDSNKVTKQPKTDKKKGGGKFNEVIGKIKTKWQNAPRYKKFLIIFFSGAIILGGSVFFVYQVIYGPKNTPPKLISITQPYLETKRENSPYLAEIKLGDPSIPRTEESPINGRLFTKEEMKDLKKRRPIAVIINNNPAARPTSNLSQADLIFETLVEGGATRMLAIFWSREPNKVGTIRSARQYFLEWLSPFDPLFIYDGFASTDNPKTDAGGNISRYGLKSIYTVGAWRVADRPAPHNEYSSTITAWEHAKTRGWEGFPNIEAWKFKKDRTMDDRRDRFEASVNISNDPSYNIRWEYEQGTNRYLRYIGGTIDTDLETSEQLSAKNVIIQEVKIEGPVDTYNRIIVDTIGSGKAKILIDGEVIDGTWKKDNRTSRTRYYKSNGDEVNLNRGLTWIVAVSQLDTKFDIIAQ